MSILKYIISALPALIVPAAAFAQETAPEVDYLYNNANAAYFYVAPDAGLEMLTLDLYTDVRSFQKIATIDLLSDDLAIHAVSGMDNVYCIPVNKENDSPVVYQIHYRYAGGRK